MFTGDSRQMDSEEGETEDELQEQPSREEITERELNRAVKRIGGTTATGMDEIPMRLVKELGPETRALLREILNQILKEGWVPEEWRTSRLRLIYKGKGQKSTLGNYHPIAITSVLYRVFTQIIRDRLQTWAEAEGVLRELQNGFRWGRRLEDNLFVLTQAIEIAQKENRPLYLCFLDISKAYDTVEHRKLWTQLEERGLCREWIDLLREVYRGTTVVAQWQQETTHPVTCSKGLRQGCPLSPLLFMLYIAGIEKRLQESGEGFSLEYSEGGERKGGKLPGLIYADDMVLMADSLQGLQGLMNECGAMGEALGLSFSSHKSGLMAFGAAEENGTANLSIQANPVPWVDHYKYLGVNLQKGHHYLLEHETKVKAKSRKNKGIATARALWGYNRYEVTRAVWKMVAVPGLTFGNSVLCLSSGTRQYLEVRQREVGRTALGASRTAPNEAVQGDMGWSGFEAREARAKLDFERRLSRMSEERWARQVFKYVHLRSVPTRWVRRTRQLAQRYEVNGPLLYPAAEQPELQQSIRTRVIESETRRWAEAARLKPTLALYAREKQEVKRIPFMDNSKGSALLSDARGGMLRTRVFRAKYMDMEVKCVMCAQGADETAEHVILECTGIKPDVTYEPDMAVALGFRGVDEQYDADSSQPVEVTKRRLECWWRRAKEHNYVFG
ncbi:uncharacterized protein LOC121046700 [Ixodes scapularis]|uniref:uncharacterized protein LOC121046700 n=1 Tax=Ixodes scapularis TaxID=6945 RepID=UPI001C3919EC|nr:uncharacterized protein LOC121046700 [Ixodes scapularis]